MALPSTFYFWVSHGAGWQEVPRHVLERCVDKVVDALVNPCLCPRLRHPASASGSDPRWDDFCKIECPTRLFRVLYRWVGPDEELRDWEGQVRQGPFIIIEAAGPHSGRNKEADVYRRLRLLFDSLPDDAGHTAADSEPCCNEADLPGDDLRSGLTRGQAKAKLLGLR